MKRRRDGFDERSSERRTFAKTRFCHFFYPCFLFWRRGADIRLNKNAATRSTDRHGNCVARHVYYAAWFSAKLLLYSQESVTWSSLFLLLVYLTTLSVCWIVESERNVQGPTYRRWFYSTVQETVFNEHRHFAACFQSDGLRKLNKERPTWCQLLYYFII